MGYNLINNINYKIVNDDKPEVAPINLNAVAYPEQIISKPIESNVTVDKTMYSELEKDELNNHIKQKLSADIADKILQSIDFVDSYDSELHLVTFKTAIQVIDLTKLVPLNEELEKSNGV